MRYAVYMRAIFTSVERKFIADKNCELFCIIFFLEMCKKKKHEEKCRYTVVNARQKSRRHTAFKKCVLTRKNHNIFENIIRIARTFQ